MLESSVPECTSMTSSWLGAESVEGLGSISSVLSSAMVSILAFPDEAGRYSRIDNETSHRVARPTKDLMSHAGTDSEANHCNLRQASNHKSDLETANGQSYPDQDSAIFSVDFSWLLERCDYDEQLVLEVLRSFCEQGQHHMNLLSTIYHSELDAAAKCRAVSFHAVNSYARVHCTASALTYFAFCEQNFLAGSACNVGARLLEQRSLALYRAARNASDCAESKHENVVLRGLIEQVHFRPFFS